MNDSNIDLDCQSRYPHDLLLDWIADCGVLGLMTFFTAVFVILLACWMTTVTVDLGVRLR